MQHISLGLQPHPQKVVRPPKSTPTFFSASWIPTSRVYTANRGLLLCLSRRAWEVDTHFEGRQSKWPAPRGPERTPGYAGNQRGGIRCVRTGRVVGTERSTESPVLRTERSKLCSNSGLDLEKDGKDKDGPSLAPNHMSPFKTIHLDQEPVPSTLLDLRTMHFFQ